MGGEDHDGCQLGYHPSFRHLPDGVQSVAQERAGSHRQFARSHPVPVRVILNSGFVDINDMLLLSTNDTLLYKVFTYAEMQKWLKTV